MKLSSNFLLGGNISTAVITTYSASVLLKAKLSANTPQHADTFGLLFVSIFAILGSITKCFNFSVFGN